MKNNKLILLCAFMLLACVTHTSAQMTVTFNPETDKSDRTTPWNSYIKDPDSMEKEGVTVSSDDADFSGKRTNTYTYVFAKGSTITIASDVYITKIVFNKHSSSSNGFQGHSSTNNANGGTCTKTATKFTWSNSSSKKKSISLRIAETGAVWVSSIEVKLASKTGENVNISSFGYVTYFDSSKSFLVPTGLNAYTYSVSDMMLRVNKVYHPGETIPAGTGVVINGPEGTHFFKYSTTEGETDPNNLLDGSDEAAMTSGDGTFYKLAQDPDNAANVGFFWGADHGAAFMNGAHKAYLRVPTSVNIRRFLLTDEITQIDSHQSTVLLSDKAFYNLQGARFLSLPKEKGIYIHQGKKIVIK